MYEAKKDQVGTKLGLSWGEAGTKLGVLDMGCWRKSFIEDEDIFIFLGLIIKKILSLQR